MDAERDFKSGNKYPYDGKRRARDWAHKAARGIMSDLLDRAGIKREFGAVMLADTRREIVDSMASIIRYAAVNHLPQTPAPSEGIGGTPEPSELELTGDSHEP